jgi:secreted trypsin-like serine protease
MHKKSKFSLLVLSSAFVFGANATEKIVGGERVTNAKEAPYMVSLSGSCGGSIISDQWVLTAAHCAGFFSEVKGGILNLKDQGVKLRIKRVVKHPQYNRTTMSNDFCLVELVDKIDFKKTGLKPVKLATPQFENDGHTKPGMDATVYGFGDIGDRQDNVSGNLNKVVVPIVSHEEANSQGAYDGEVDKTMLAAGYAAGGKDSCQGDSGGPLVVFNHRNTPVQIGIVSWGEGCAAPQKYGIYSRVSVGHQWIKETTKIK